MSLLTKLWQSDLIVGGVLATAWLSAFINSPAIRRAPEALWTWPFTPEARDAAILVGLAMLVLAPVPFTGWGYAVRAATPALLAYVFAQEWLDAEDDTERGIVALVGTFGVLFVLAITWPATLLPVLGLALLTGAGCWLAGRGQRNRGQG